MNELIVFAATFVFALCSEIRCNTFPLLIAAALPLAIGVSFYFIVTLMPTMTEVGFSLYLLGGFCGFILGDAINKMLAIDISELMK